MKDEYFVFDSRSFGGRLPLCSIPAKTIIPKLDGIRMNDRMARSIDFEATFRRVPLMRFLEVGVMEPIAVGGRHIIILMGKPSLPFRWNHVPVGASHR